MTEEEFDNNYVQALDTLLANMAENSEVDLRKFYSTALVLENLRFFSPVLYSMITDAKK